MSHAERICNSHQLRQRLRPHLSHYASAVHLHGYFGQSHLVRDLLVHKPRSNETDDLFFAGREGIKAIAWEMESARLDIGI